MSVLYVSLSYSFQGYKNSGSIFGTRLTQNPFIFVTKLIIKQEALTIKKDKNSNKSKFVYKKKKKELFFMLPMETQKTSKSLSISKRMKNKQIYFRTNSLEKNQIRQQKWAILCIELSGVYSWRNNPLDLETTTLRFSLRNNDLFDLKGIEGKFCGLLNDIASLCSWPRKIFLIWHHTRSGLLSPFFY